MESNQQPDLRPPQLKEVLERHAPNEKLREVAVNAAGGFFDAKDFSAAMRRIGVGRRLHLPPGEHRAADIGKSIYLRGSATAPSTIVGSIKMEADHASISNLEIRATAGTPAITISRGTVILDGCAVRGDIRVEKGARLFLKNCLVRGNEEAVSVDKAYVEIHTSRIEGAQVGLALRDQSTGAVYHCYFHKCVTPHESDWGAGILASDSEVYCEATTFSKNGVGVYLTDCKGIKILSSHFVEQQAASLISTGQDTTRISIRSCVIEGQVMSHSPQLCVTAGHLIVESVEVKASQVSALASNSAETTISRSQFAAEREAALDILGGSVTADRLTCESHGGPAIRAGNCKGSIRESVFTGMPPSEIENAPELLLEDCHLSDYRAELGSRPNGARGTSTDIFIKELVNGVNQESVRAEMERILRMAHASRERSLSGLPLPEQSFHAVFTGSPDSGKFDAARILGRGLHSFGMTTQPDAEQIDISSLLSNGVNGSDSHEQDLPGGGTYLISTPKTGFNKDLREIRRILEKLVQKTGTIVILDGQREEMRFLIRSSPILERAFRHFLHFPEYGPIELMALFTQLCKKDHIAVKPETAIGALMLFHTQCDRKDRRLTTTEGVEALYDSARQRFLERSSRYNRFDLPLEPQDLDIYHEKAVRLALESNPAFASFCPECSKENPWVLGLSHQTTCFHCGTVYEATWGLWKDSVSYRRLKEFLTNSGGTGTPARRILFSQTQ